MNACRLDIDETYCWGCKTCEVACKQEHRAPEGVKLITVHEDGPRAVDGRLTFVFRVARCRHCEDPACLPACPVEAITRRAADGIVVLASARCTGCRACIDACPFAAIAFDAQNDVALKCNLCYQRVDQGLLPACADNVCPGHCIRFTGPDGVTDRPVGLRAGS